MAFKKITVVCDGSVQPLYSTSTILEGNLHSILVTNPTGLTGLFSLYYDGVEMFKMTVAPNGFEAVPKPVNVPAQTVVEVKGSTGMLVLASAYEQAIDTVAALNVVQDAVTHVDGVKGTIDTTLAGLSSILPAGSISDSTTSTTTAWSSTKVANELSNVELLIYAGV